MQIGTIVRLVLWWWASDVSGVLLREPEYRWTTSLPSGLIHGNSIMMIDSDSRLLVTTQQGSIHVLDAKSGTEVMNFRPTSTSLLHCSSAAVVWNEFYAIYSVRVFEEPSESTENLTNSLVTAVDIRSGTVLWQSNLPGAVVGTPQLGAEFLYVVHNLLDGTGTVTVMEPSIGAVIASYTGDGPFGPGILQTLDDRDVIVLAVSRDDGLASAGALYLLVQNSGGERFQMVQASTFLASASAPPLVTPTLEIYLGQQGSTVSGWTGRSHLRDVWNTGGNVQPRWTRILDLNTENSETPILAAPIMSADGSLIYVASAGMEVYALSVSQGRIIWSEAVTGQVIASPVYVAAGSSIGEDAIYFIETSGLIRQYRASSSQAARLNWSINCTQTESCDATVEGNFAVSENGNVLYYGDSRGRIRSLSVASFATDAPTAVPSEAPSMIPSLAPVAPSIAPTEFPSFTATNTPTARPTSEPTVNIFSGGGSFDHGNNLTDTEGIDQTTGDDDTSDETSGDDTRQNTTDALMAERRHISGIDNQFFYLGVAAVGLLVLVILCAIFMICRRDKPSDIDHEMEKVRTSFSSKGETKAYDLLYEQAEKETLAEILGPDIAAAQTALARSRSYDSPAAKTTQTLSSIAESPDSSVESRERDVELGDETGFEVTLADFPLKSSRPVARNLSKRFASLRTPSNNSQERPTPLSMSRPAATADALDALVARSSTPGHESGHESRSITLPLPSDPVIKGAFVKVDQSSMTQSTIASPLFATTATAPAVTIAPKGQDNMEKAATSGVALSIPGIQTGHQNFVTTASLSESNSLGYASKSQVNSAITTLLENEELGANIVRVPVDESEDEPGRIVTRLAQKQADRPSSSWRSGARPASPSLSDILSTADDSLYTEEERADVDNLKKTEKDDEITSFSIFSNPFGRKSSSAPETARSKRSFPKSASDLSGSVDVPDDESNSQLSFLTNPFSFPLAGVFDIGNDLSKPPVQPESYPQAQQYHTEPDASSSQRLPTELKSEGNHQERVTTGENSTAAKPVENGSQRAADTTSSPLRSKDLPNVAPPSPPLYTAVRADGDVSKMLSYSGVSVRPARTRAGLFTRRQHKGVSEGLNSIDTLPQATLSVRTPERSAARPRDPDGEIATPRSANDEPVVNARTGRMSAARKTSPKQSEEDAWQSFMNELSRAEASLFSTTSYREASPPTSPPQQVAGKPHPI